MNDMEPLYCYRLIIDRRRLAVLVSEHGHPLNSEDTGYHIHALLAACFGRVAPSPFSVDPDGRNGGPNVTVMAYGAVPWDQMKEVARETAQGPAYKAILWENSACKPMPQRWMANTAYNYKVRVCPVRRQKRENGGVREIDVFLLSPTQAYSDDRPTLLRRQAAYELWLKEQIEGCGPDLSKRAEWQGGARIDSCSLTGFRLSRFIRHDAEGRLRPVPDPRLARNHGVSGRPDAVLRGKLIVTDSLRFNRLLARGVGRHRAFGFGMLLLKRS